MKHLFHKLTQTNRQMTDTTRRMKRHEDPEYRPPNTAFEVALISAIIVMVVYVVSKLM